MSHWIPSAVFATATSIEIPHPNTAEPFHQTIPMQQQVLFLRLPTMCTIAEINAPFLTNRQPLGRRASEIVEQSSDKLTFTEEGR